MEIYIILMSITFILMLLDSKIRHKKWIFFILCVALTLISAIRYDVGSDYINTYVNAFRWLKIGLRHDYEILFLWLNKFLIQHDGTAVQMLSICAVFTIPLFFRFIRNNVEQRYWFLAVYLYLVSTIYFASMNAVRQYVALAILLFGFDYLKEKRYIHYSLFIVLAMMFHSSAVMAFLYMAVYYIYSNNMWKKVCNALFITLYSASIFLMFVDLREVVPFFSYIIPDRYLGYLTSAFMINRNYDAILKQVIPNFILFCMIKDSKQLRKEYPYFDLCYVGWIIYILITNLYYGINMFIRLGYYFDYLVMLIVPMLLAYYRNNLYRLDIRGIKIKRFDWIIGIMVVTYYTALTIYSIFLKGGHGVVPYQTIFKQ